LFRSARKAYVLFADTRTERNKSSAKPWSTRTRMPGLSENSKKRYRNYGNF